MDLDRFLDDREFLRMVFDELINALLIDCLIQ